MYVEVDNDIPFLTTVEAGAVLALIAIVIEITTEGVALAGVALIGAASRDLLIRHHNGVSRQQTNLLCTFGSQRGAVVGALASHMARLTTACRSE
jgi:hypothetical protein